MKGEVIPMSLDVEIPEEVKHRIGEIVTELQKFVFEKYQANLYRANFIVAGNKHYYAQWWVDKLVEVELPKK